ncbi:MAG: arsenic resistance N-acetyltransferase ArsN2 [Pseudomonadota bacterium]
MPLATLQPQDFTAVTELLTSNSLLAMDLTPADMDTFIGCRSEGELVAVGALQSFGAHGLLRSIATNPRFRGRGCAAEIVRQLEANADQDHLDAVYLLTEIAEPFFEARGYTRVAREHAPESLRSTPQFAELCPDVAACMVKRLPGEQPSPSLEDTRD